MNPINNYPVKNALLENDALVQPWSTWFQSIVNTLGFKNNHGQAWMPVVSGLTTAGSVTISGHYSRIGNILVASIKIATSGGGTSASVLGTTYLTLPFTLIQETTFTVVNLTTKASLGVCLAQGNRVYVPAWLATTDNILISGSGLTDD
jgi:hypothetical protein